MFKQMIEGSRTASKIALETIPAKDIREYFEVVVDLNHDFGSALAEAGDKYFQEMRKLGPKSK